LIALVIEETNEEFFANSFWAEVVQGFSSVISEAGLHPLMLIRQKNSTEESLFATLQAGQMDALAIFGWHKPIKVLENLLVPDLSVVFGGDFGGSKKYPFVDVDNLKGGFIATKHLIDSGCKKIAIITGDLTLQSSRDRLSGYEEALAKFGVKFEEQLLVHGDFTQTTAEKLVRALIKSKVKFDGIFASNDLMARGAIKELIAHGIQVPKEVKVVGFDDSRIAADNEIPITSIKQPIRELGTEVALSLLSSLNGEKVHNKLLDVKLIKRKSSTTGQN
jgi:LacI family transcriptional regulator